MNTLYILCAEFGTGDIPLEQVAAKYLGIDSKSAKMRAARADLPFPAYRPGSQKSPWLVRASDLAAWLDGERAKAQAEWDKRRVA